MFATSFFVRKPNFLLGDIQSLWSGVSHETQLELVRENQDLKNKLYAGTHDIAVREENLITAKVFSLYPFNTKNRIYANIGIAQGSMENAAVLFSPRVFFGLVAGTAQHTSEIKTVFDSSLEIPVRIGDREINGLLQGGLAPRITLIDKTKQVHSGDVIVTAAKDMPYGLTVGIIKETHEDSLGAFLESTITLPYSLSDVRTVLIVPFP